MSMMYVFLLVISADYCATARQVGALVQPFPGGGQGNEWQLLLCGLPLPHTQRDQEYTQLSLSNLCDSFCFQLHLTIPFFSGLFFFVYLSVLSTSSTFFTLC